MSIGTPVAADCPSLFDVVLNGQGYILLRTIDTSLPFRTQRARYGRTPTFIERSNISGAYGDNQQDFFLTVSQNNWSGGEQQKYFRSDTGDTSYWRGANINQSVPGQVSLSRDVISTTFAAAVSAQAGMPGFTTDIVTASATNLYRLDAVGTITNQGAHGLGATPNKYGMVTNGQSAFLTTSAAGSVGVRKMTSGGVFSTFSATPADSLAILNNSLYGLNRDNTNARLLKYDIAGVATSVYDWKSPDNTILTFGPGRVIPYGGKLLILLSQGGETFDSELWQYDTTVTKLEVFPPNFVATEMEVLYGIAYISGVFTRTASATTSMLRSAVLSYDGSQISLLWKAQDYNPTYVITTTNVSITGPWPALTVFDGSLVWNDDYNGQLMRYDPATGAVSSFATYGLNGNTPLLHGGQATLLLTLNQAGAYQFPATTYASSGYVVSSLFDFDNSLTKQFRGIKVDFSSATDGNGGTVDIAYRVDDVDGTYTTLQTGAVSGTEYTLSGISGHSISLKITLNKGTSTAGPVLKRTYVRAAPVLQSYRSCEYIFDCSGRDGRVPVILNDDLTPHPLDGLQMATNINTALVSTSPISITDRFGTYTGIIEPDKTDIIEVAPEEYIIRVTTREV